MIELIKSIDIDIKRCESLIIQNDYLEIVIAIEEVFDKYKDSIPTMQNSSKNIVWNYSKKDIENILNILKQYKESLLKMQKEENVTNKINNFKNSINDYELIDIINKIEYISNEKISTDEKWNKLKINLDIVKNLNKDISIKLLELIILIIED